MLEGPEGRHAATVRRIRVGEPITLSDGRGVLADSEVVAAQRDRLKLVVHDRVLAAVSPLVTVVQALPKSDRSELAVELMTEAGVDVVVPSQACPLRRRTGWQAAKATTVAPPPESAARQSRRAYIPEDRRPAPHQGILLALITAKSDGAIAAALHESRGRFAELPFEGAAEIVLIVGPEGA